MTDAQLPASESRLRTGVIWSTSLRAMPHSSRNDATVVICILAVWFVGSGDDENENPAQEPTNAGVFVHAVNRFCVNVTATLAPKHAQTLTLFVHCSQRQ